MRTALLAAATLSLAALAVLQLGTVHVPGSRSVAAPRPLLPNDTMTLLAGELARSAMVETPEARCWELFVVDPLCRACQALAERFNADDRRMAESHWLVAGQVESASWYVSHYGLGDDKVLRVSAGSRGGLNILRTHGIFAVPTRVLLDENYVVRDIRISREIATAEEIDAYCSVEPFR